MGKYSKVLRQYGKAGFGVPSKAPNVGSFPLYPLSRARYALTILASPNYDSKTGLRARIAKRAIALHPSLRSYWSQLNRETIKPRLSRSTRRKAANPRRNTTDYAKGARVGENDFDLSMEPGFETKTRAELKRAGKSSDYIRGYLEQVKKEEDEFDSWLKWMEATESFNPRRKNMARRRNYGRIRLLQNPLGMPLGRGKAVIVDEHYRRRSGSAPKRASRVHIQNPNDPSEALCGAGNGRVVAGPDKGQKKGVKPSKSKTVTCYRCIKIRIVDEGHDYERMLYDVEPGKRATHMMVPGGRQGRYISGKRPSDDPPGTIFLGGPRDHPTQTRLLSPREKAKRRADLVKKRSRKVGAGRAIARRGETVANPRSYKQGYSRGAKDYRSPKPTPASRLKQRSMSYQTGYLEGYADQADKRYGGRTSTSRYKTKRSHRSVARRRPKAAVKRRTNRGKSDWQRFSAQKMKQGYKLEEIGRMWRSKSNPSKRRRNTRRRRRN